MTRGKLVKVGVAAAVLTAGGAIAGEAVKPGNIIVKQNGSVFHPGKNTYMSKTHSIHAQTDGVVKFRRMTGFKRGQFYIDVVESK